MNHTHPVHIKSLNYEFNMCAQILYKRDVLVSDALIIKLVISIGHYQPLFSILIGISYF